MSTGSKIKGWLIFILVSITCSVILFLSLWQWGKSKLNYRNAVAVRTADIIPAVKKAAEDDFKTYLANDGDTIKIISVELVCQFSNHFVAEKLEFDENITTNDLSKIWFTQKTNSSGYATLQVAVLNHLFALRSIDATAEYHIGKLYWRSMSLPDYHGAMLPLIFQSLNGNHSYPVVYVNGDRENPLFPDACIYDNFILRDGFLVTREYLASGIQPQ